MHGTPLKTFGLEARGEHPTAESVRKFIARNATWNYLVVQGGFTAKKARDCFGINVKKMRTGYPRTDVLHDPPQEEFL